MELKVEEVIDENEELMRKVEDFEFTLPEDEIEFAAEDRDEKIRNYSACHMIDESYMPAEKQTAVSKEYEIPEPEEERIVGERFKEEAGHSRHEADASKGYLESDQIALRKQGYQEFMDAPGSFRDKLIEGLRKKEKEMDKKSYKELYELAYKQGWGVC